MHFWLIFIAVLGLVSAASCYCCSYIFPSSVYPYVRGGIILVNLSFFPLLLFLGDRKDFFFASPLLTGVSIVFTAEVILLALVGAALLLRRLWHLMNPPIFDSERRELLSKAFLYPAASLALAAYGSGVERKSVVVRNFDIPVEGNFAPFKIAQISDVHLGLFFDLNDLRELMDKTLEEKPDVLAITGDLFDNAAMNREAAEIIDEYADKFPYGIYFCWGNHEYYRNIKKTREYLEKSRIKLLENNAVIVRDGERPLYFAGADYPMERLRFDELRDEYADMALKDIPAEAATVLLAHHPEFIDNAAAKNVLLTLTGHTHGCQIGILGQPIFPVFKYNRGLVRHGNSYGYVHCGNGSWFPVRIGCPPEIACFTLAGKVNK